MKIIYVHHALRKLSNPPTQEDKIQPLGIKDAKTTAKLLKIMSENSKSNFKAIYTSPYYRCKKTAKLLINILICQFMKNLDLMSLRKFLKY